MVVLVFIVCQSCKIIPDLYEVIICSQGGDRCMSTQSIEAIIDISHLMLTINSSVNFFIYIIHRGQFRESIVSLLSRGMYIGFVMYIDKKCHSEIVNVNHVRHLPDIHSLILGKRI